MDFSHGMKSCRPTRVPLIDLHVVTRHDALYAVIPDEVTQSLIIFHQIPGISLEVSRRPHSFQICIPVDAIPCDDMGSAGRLDLDPLGAEGVAVCCQATVHASADFRIAIDEIHSAGRSRRLEEIEELQIHGG